ncbi:hypothetical protein JMJ58_19490 [Haloterrigena salifodinae]|uniref:Homing endonuclease LAGLIDADG domain-containing protein n=1 Tax=Haloterrigena salifodinae TaxID=2675099 RepID=A0A8T8DZV5_9EURY|nr:hypothetical protein [Haloterrigena salifodinae]QRV15065.1 hypothetical protein JMJ58_19490 [Haloterrigena salifodinae]
MPENDWRAVYAAAALDWGGNLKASLRKKGSSKFGYEITFEVSFKKSSPEAVGLIDEFCTDLGLNPKATIDERDEGDQYVVRLTRRDEVREFLEVVFPFLAARHEQAEILLEDVFPALDEGRHRSAEGMVEVASMLDRVQERGFQRGGSHKKYDAETVADDLGVDL